MSINETIENQLREDNIVLYMKGTRDFPQCGFSGRVVQILRSLDVDFQEYNILEDDELRQGIKAYANWPTIPQLYVRGEFVGGCDIISELYENEELEAALSAS